MAKLTERQRINLSIELRQLQETVARDMKNMAGQLEHKYLPKWDSYEFDEDIAAERVKWLKKFDAKMKIINKDFFTVFFKRDMGR